MRRSGSAVAEVRVGQVDATRPADYRIRHHPGLDGVRGLAILCVLGAHGGWLAGGHMGVTVFFVLSGFLITSMLLEEHARTGRVNLRFFYRRRAARLMPALLVVLAVTVAAVALLVGVATAARLMWTGALPTLVDVLNFRIVHAPREADDIFAWGWSLSIEEQFYLVWPAVCLLGLRTRRPAVWLATSCLSLTAVAVVLRVSTHYGSGTPVSVYYGTATRMDALLVGCLVGVRVFSRRRPDRWVRFASTACLLVVLVAVVGAGTGWSMTYVVGLPLTEVAAAGLILSVLDARDGAVAGVLSVAALRYLGRRAYGLYLWNIPVLAAVVAVVGPHPSAATRVAWLALVLMVAELSHRCVERPILNRVRPSAPAIPVPRTAT